MNCEITIIAGTVYQYADSVGITSSLGKSFCGVVILSFRIYQYSGSIVSGITSIIKTILYSKPDKFSG